MTRILVAGTRALGRCDKGFGQPVSQMLAVNGLPAIGCFLIGPLFLSMAWFLLSLLRDDDGRSIEGSVMELELAMSKMVVVTQIAAWLGLALSKLCRQECFAAAGRSALAAGLIGLGLLTIAAGWWNLQASLIAGFTLTLLLLVLVARPSADAWSEPYRRMYTSGQGEELRTATGCELAVALSGPIRLSARSDRAEVSCSL